MGIVTLRAPRPGKSVASVGIPHKFASQVVAFAAELVLLLEENEAPYVGQVLREHAYIQLPRENRSPASSAG